MIKYWEVSLIGKYDLDASDIFNAISKSLPEIDRSDLIVKLIIQGSE